MTAPPRNSVRARRICFETHRKQDDGGTYYMVCSCGCGQRFNPATTRWRADHGARWGEGGRDVPENLWPIIEAHDAGKGNKAAKDTKEVAKGKRMGEKHYGVSKGAKKGRPMPFGKTSRLKKKLNGQVVERE